MTPIPYALYALNGPGSTGLWAANLNNIYNTNLGNVGIGTTSPAGKLHVENPSVYGDITFLDAGGGQDDLAIDPSSKYTDNINRVYIVEVTHSFLSPDEFKWSDDNGASWSSDQLEMTTDWYDLSYGVRIKWDDTDGHYDSSGETEGDRWTWVAFRGYENSLVVKNGNVGIGTTSPTEKLDIDGNIQLRSTGEHADIHRVNNDHGLRLYATDTLTYTPTGAAIQVFGNDAGLPGQLFMDSGAHDDAALIFRTAGTNGTITERMRISSSGNVGIGTTNPSYKLHVEGGVIDYLGYFYNDNITSGNAYGIYAQGNAYDTGTGWGMGGHFIGKGSSEGGQAYGTKNYAYAHGSSIAYGVYSYAIGGTTTGKEYAFYGIGDGHFNGTLTKGGGSFMIDHPLDPENKYLSHSFVESPDMMNVYNGNIILDDNGEARIEMPDWFEALNRDFRYQLTCIGGFAPVYIANEISGNTFKIAGGQPQMKVSWQVTGIRQDAFANANRIPVEEDKSEKEQGTYLHAEAFGVSEEMSLHKVHQTEMTQERKRKINISRNKQ